jgi:hypothetical protein
VTREIGRPVGVWTERDADGAHRGLQIDDADGQTSRVWLCPPALPELLDAVAETE